MLQVEFAQNWNGKLFNDHFVDIRIHNPSIYVVGKEVEILEKSMGHGIAEIIAVRPFPYGKINGIASYCTMGKPPAYLAEVLKRMNGGHIDGDTVLCQVVFKYTERYKENQSSLIADWWKTKIS